MLTLNAACHKLLADIHAMESGPIPPHHNISVDGDDFDTFKYLILAGYATGADSSDGSSVVGSYHGIRTTPDGQTYLNAHA
ncbi:MAG: hypothetical protein KJ643_15215 [Gammaproteobacteria bacterium]|uniref:hypothetical protein n=1 Tax=Pseudomonas mandelii TaxID=75612 RepID=UPI0012B2B554|nr:hypothetical protein [Pseudomonas mandelii]MBU0523582.1 hypothetical protein [Gammaproteobacteria bacterium]MBU0844618.1 hypothetical protein [Gammaproteobacteria bacterium]MBU1843671.1 hypothetical protein [Gammaproteobacteria bacterium]MSU92833.1 hypothetical protein [Pseudomonas mandelii]